MALSKLEGLITIPTGGYSVAVAEDGGTTPTTVTFSAGDYYLTSTATGGSASLLGHIKAQLDAAMSGTYTVSVSDADASATGKVTISVAGGASTFAISDWDTAASDTTLMDILGFTGVIADGATATGANHAKHLWLPNVTRSEFLGPDGSGGAHQADHTVTFSPGGKSKRLAYNRWRVDVLGFRYLTAAKTWTDHESVTGESLEQYWIDSIYPGKLTRYYKDRSDDSTYFEYTVHSGASFQPTPEVQGWEGANSCWAWRTDLSSHS